MMTSVCREKAAFERGLLKHVELCYSVALALTGVPRRAEELARETLEWGWHLQHEPRDDRALKMVLLSELRRRFREAGAQPVRQWFFAECAGAESDT